MSGHISDKTHFKETVEVFPTPPDTPSLSDYVDHLRYLNNNYDRPFRVRYFKSEFMRAADLEQLMVGAEFLLNELDSRIDTTHKIAKALGK